MADGLILENKITNNSYREKCINCHYREVELVRLKTDGTGGFTQNIINVCVNPKCIMHIDINKLKGYWEVVNKK